MKAFRVDKRLFNKGDIIDVRSENPFFSVLKENGKTIEKFLEKHRPANFPQRKTAVFLFKEEKPARKFWSKMKDGKLYKVIFSCETHFEGDMNFTEEMYKAGEDSELIKAAKKYWSGEKTSKPEIEILLFPKTSVKVIEVISTSDEERLSAFKKRCKL